jgi:membrane-bound lytic murein transglycosylase B
MAAFHFLSRISVIQLSLILGATWFQSGRALEPAYQPLERRLAADGLDSMRLAVIFSDPRVRFVPALVELNLVSREFPDYYQGFLTANQIEDGIRFLRQWQPQIEVGLKGTQVPVETAVAILKIESDLGRRPGRHSVFNTLASITLLKDSLQWTAQFDTSGGADLERLQRRAVRRSDWAYTELAQYLKLCDRENWDPLEVAGSWAGAFGWAQFLPSSYLRCARDGDGDGKVDPYALQDAVASIGAYLHEAGWRSTPASQRRAVMLYNPSSAYVDCIFEYARKLRQKISGSNQNSSQESYNR